MLEEDAGLEFSGLREIFPKSAAPPKGYIFQELEVPMISIWSWLVSCMGPYLLQCRKLRKWAFEAVECVSCINY